MSGSRCVFAPRPCQSRSPTCPPITCSEPVRPAALVNSLPDMVDDTCTHSPQTRGLGPARSQCHRPQTLYGAVVAPRTSASGGVTPARFRCGGCESRRETSERRYRSNIAERELSRGDSGSDLRSHPQSTRDRTDSVQLLYKYPLPLVPFLNDSSPL
ncbi:hypothetical protein BV25DRAFT_555466 [Artomyces pyxidatus]|uniref:Uncharacterized protein n=1 Tax=Artomyces pyxidatus TaxID=48021 RepID=A0ACB8TIN7_9AGAM|nr:hypothetical protein BV25DRAFT_555466 [Artomyces pyxidatus]